MPLYSFHLPFASAPQEHDLQDDHAAWSEVVTTLGRLLQDVDGALPRMVDWTLRVTEGEREVARIEMSARLHSRREPKNARHAAE